MTLTNGVPCSNILELVNGDSRSLEILKDMIKTRKKDNKDSCID